MPERRLQDRIRELCGRLLYEKEPEWSTTLQELQAAMQEHVLRIENLTTAAIVGRPIVERRKSAKP